MKSQDLELKELVLVLIPLLAWGAIGWFLLPHLIAASGDPDMSPAALERITVISYSACMVCLAFVLLLVVYLAMKKRQALFIQVQQPLEYSPPEKPSYPPPHEPPPPSQYEPPEPLPGDKPSQRS